MLDIPQTKRKSTRKRKVIATTPEFKRKLARFEASAKMNEEGNLLGYEHDGKVLVESDASEHNEEGASSPEKMKSDRPREEEEGATKEPGAGLTIVHEDLGVSGAGVGAGAAAAAAAASDQDQDQEITDKITDTATLLILRKFDEASKERNAISSAVEVSIKELREDVKKVEKKAEIVEAMQGDLKKVQEGMALMDKRVSELENSGKNVLEEMKKQMEKIREDEARTRNLKEKLLADISEEEKCCLVIGFSITSTERERIVDGLIAAIAKEGANKEEMKRSMTIAWSKPENNPRGRESRIPAQENSG